MAKQWISASAPSEGRASLTVAGSIVLHGAIVAVAALWPVAYAAPPKELPPTVIYNETGIQAQEPPVLENNPAPPDMPSEPPVLVDEVPIDTPPILEEPRMDLSTPKPVPRTVEHKVRSPRAPASPGSFARNTQTATAAVPGSTVGGDRPGAAGRWRTPQPPYPVALRMARISGSGSVRIATDGAGRVTGASVAQSTGNALLDENTCRFARTNWSGPPNATVTVPITYQMR